MPGAELSYSITLRRLRIKGEKADPCFRAWSGGQGGSTRDGAADPFVTNNVFLMSRKTDHAKGTHGGPLPIGEYAVAAPARHPHLGLAAKLTPTGKGLTFGMFGRDGFYIHGRGPHGSDGCIVPERNADFHALMRVLAESGGGTITVWP